ncbi:DUF3800 domain-containing protein [Azospirillum sp. A23]|uniref:DUF3800 domain-containing protein n=1 Tax=Azospirillum sp. A23 TaxID=3160608 RepID=UPI0036F42432
MYAFVDETGNTGANLFDEKQPDFFTGAMITKTNFDIIQRNNIKKLCERHGIVGIHASVIGPDKVEDVADSLINILKKSDARFFISRVEKRYLLATKLFDTFFDAGENPAASWLAYNVRLMRLMLCLKVSTIITDDIARKFWDMLMAKREAIARAMIPDICEALLARVPLIVDKRSQEIITQTLEWSRSHPEALDIFIPGRQAKNGHMPNMVAFVNLMEGLEQYSKRWGRPLKKMVHDRQSQFEGTLQEWHRMHSNASPEPIKLIGETVVLQKLHGSQFEISASDASPGIQIADVVLWLFRQMLNGKALGENSNKLLQYAIKKGWHNDFTFEGVNRRAELAYENMMRKDISDEELERGKQLVALKEEHRLQAIKLYEQDGLMPYERDWTMTASLQEPEGS